MAAARNFHSLRFGGPAVTPQSLGVPAAAYPGRVATNADLIVAVDRQQSTLLLALGAGDTTMTVLDPSRIGADNLLSIDDEIVKTTGPPAGNVVPISRGFDGTVAAAHASGAIIAGLVDAWHHNALVAEVEAIENTLGANLSRLSSTGLIIFSSAYNFVPQSPGGNLTVGTNGVTLSPVPLGVNGSDVMHYLYISGGTGAAEAALITGGSAVAGAASGTLFITCANAHSGAWTVQSDSGGIYEAINTLPAGGGTVMIPNATTALVAGLNGIVYTRNNVALTGSGWSSVIQARPGANQNTLLQLNGSNILIRDLKIDGNVANGGSAINSTGQALQLGTSANPAINTLVDHVEVTGAGAWGITYTAGAHDDVVQNSYIHDIGPITGPGPANGFAMSFGGLPRPFNMHIRGCRIERVYNKDATLGPGASGAIGGDATDVSIEGNDILDCIQQGGGMIANGGADGIQRNWNVRNNRIVKTITLNADATSGIEMNGLGLLATGNVVSGMTSGGSAIAVEGAAGQVHANHVIANNQLYNNAFGIILINAGGSVSRAVISGNRIAGMVSGSVGIRVESACSAIDIIGNDLTDCATPVTNAAPTQVTLIGNGTVPNYIRASSTLYDAGTVQTLDSGTGVATSGAATLSHQTGTVESEILTTAAGGTYTLTLTNTLIVATSKIFANAYLGTSTTGTPQVVGCTPFNGSMICVVRNVHATQAFNGSIKIQFLVN